MGSEKYDTAASRIIAWHTDDTQHGRIVNPSMAKAIADELAAKHAAGKAEAEGEIATLRAALKVASEDRAVLGRECATWRMANTAPASAWQKNREQIAKAITNTNASGALLRGEEVGNG